MQLSKNVLLLILMIQGLKNGSTHFNKMIPALLELPNMNGTKTKKKKKKKKTKKKK